MKRACTVCGRVSDQARCPQHRAARTSPTHKGWTGGSTWAWRTIRARILLRDPYCTVMLRCNGDQPSTHVDHILPKSKGGTDEDTNLRGSCAPCNLARGDA